MRRILTAREQVEMMSPWRLAAPPSTDPGMPRLVPPVQGPAEAPPKPPRKKRTPQPTQETLFPEPKKAPREKAPPPPKPQPEQLGLFPHPNATGPQMPIPTNADPDFSWSQTLPMDKMTEALLAKYDAADDDTKDWGHQWYDNATEYVNNLAAATHRDPKQVAAVMAAFSPQTAWDQNMASATHFLLNYDPDNPDALNKTNMPGLAGDENLERAKRIMGATDEAGYLAAMHASSDAPKITSFYKNMTGDRNAVTLDSWMAKAILGEGSELADPNLAQTALGWAGSYDRMSEAVRRAAKARGIDPRALQAVVWTHVNNTANYGDYTPETYQKKKDQREKQWRRTPLQKPLPDYTHGPAWNSLVTPNPGKPLLPPPVLRSAPGYHHAAEDSWGGGFGQEISAALHAVRVAARLLGEP